MLPSFGFMFLVLVTLSGIPVYAQNSDLWPAAYPLAVRSPYLQAWVSTMNGSHPTVDWPTFWESEDVCTSFITFITYNLFCIRRLDGQATLE